MSAILKLGFIFSRVPVNTHKPRGNHHVPRIPAKINVTVKSTCLANESPNFHKPAFSHKPVPGGRVTSLEGDYAPR